MTTLTPPTDSASRAAALVAEIAAQYDNEDGDLARAALGRLERLQAVSGKVCSKCETKKPLSAFGVDGRKVTGLKAACKACLAGAGRERRSK